MRTRAFSLLEVLVSILIFSIVSVALIGVLTGAVRIFRTGESARAAHDEAVAVLAQLDDDLAHMVPQGDGGFFYLRVRDADVNTPGYDPDPLKSMILAFKIRNPDAQAATAAATAVTKDTTSDKSRLIVAWWVDNNGWLNRATRPTTEWQDDHTRQPELTEVANAVAGAGRLARNCLYFGADLSLDDNARTDLEWSTCQPLGTAKYCTEPITGNPASFQPFPRAIRISVTLTGGSRNLISGNVVSDTGSGIRVSGIGQVPAGAGALARIGDPTVSVEWVRYDKAAGGLLTWQGARPIAARRTTATTHARGEPVVIGTSYSLVRSLPR